MATDGSCFKNGERDAKAGAGIFVKEHHPLNRSFRLPENIEQSNQTGEITATLLATMTAPKDVRVIQETDSKTTMDALTKWQQRHEDTGYIMQKNAILLQTVTARLRMRQGHTLFRWVKGHNGHIGNEAADKLAAIGAGKEKGEPLPLSIPLAFMVTGAKLQCMTQKLAYRAIRALEDKRTDPRPRTMANMDRIVSGLEACFDIKAHDTTIWSSLRSKHVSRPASQFMWMAIHDAYMIGTHWLRPNMSNEMRARAICAICGEQESMSHILFECKARGQELIWALLKNLWELTGAEWKEPCWGNTFGAACAVFKSDKGCRKTATEHLWCILSTETTHFIWKMRCERVIQKEGEEFTENEIANRFVSTLDGRLNLDRRTAARARTLGKKALKPHEVEQIWLPVINDKEHLPPRWVTDSGVLVGIKRGR
ncbi:ribonuclease H-like protein [Polyporus arcularius HHB13444]|uniref:ribonuclease H n=1 Tax=Polyporus arcularius HHB13444 TaxID=1314778 RepID=A0A5C3NUG9_9APHY|nr:ribonuclease H-like protein [Polyporus arcularius HHB13444]